MIYRDIELQEIKELYKKGTQVICFWGGEAFGFLLGYLDRENILITAVVDNNINKQGKFIHWNGKDLCKIISVSELLEFDMGNVILIITVQGLEEIIQLLLGFKQLETVPVAYYGYILDNVMKSNIIQTTDVDLEIPQECIRIPRTIHYCWFGGKELPDQYKKWMESWKKYCPGYEIIRWDESNYDVHKIPYIDEAYKSGKYSFVSDYARLDILYNHGGIYLDTDVEMLRPLDNLLCQKAFMGTEFPSNMVATGLGMGAVPKHYGIKLLMDDYLNHRFIRDDGTLNLTTCPVIQSNLLQKYGLKLNGKRQKVCDIEIYPNMVFSPYLPYRKQIVYNGVSYLCHHYSASWVDDKAKSKAKRISELYKLFK